MVAVPALAEDTRGTFTDDNNNTHEGYIEAIAAIGVTNGCSSEPMRFCPSEIVSRAEMASFLARALELPASFTDHFTDDDGTTHEANINAVADAQITLGVGDGKYDPNGVVTRAQMASFLARGLELPASTNDHFADDDGDPHEAAINAVADRRITLGCGGGSYCPEEPVRRDQMATFMGRALDLEALTGVPQFFQSGFPSDFRSIDGTGNNLANPAFGSAVTALLRMTTVDYGDGVGTPAGAGRASARQVSNDVSNQTSMMPNADGLNDLFWQWGQFLDHDIDLTGGADPAEAFDIEVPLGDVFFDPFSTGTQVIPLSRSVYDDTSGVRQQLNEITAFIDASNVYGSDATRAAELRTLDGTGRLKTSGGMAGVQGAMLPFNVNGLPNAQPDGSDPADFFLAGDVRANEQVALTAVHTLFVREHNYWAARLGLIPGLTGDEIYELARALVGAEMQAITYNEFLPMLLGPGALSPYSGYDQSVDPGIANLFSTVTYRFGHTMVSPTLQRISPRGGALPAGHLDLANAFFSPEELLDSRNRGIEPLLRGLASQQAQEVDGHLVDAIRNFMFGPPGAGGFDLASLNIQRGRDHGLPGYNQARIDLGLPPVASFADITSDVDIQNALAGVYGSVDDIDAWVGVLCEDHVAGATVGETVVASLTDQFERLRDGDRFWYENQLSPELVSFVNEQTLRRIIVRNTRIRYNQLPQDIFVAP